jgi:uncharacterized protein (DUF427 family)
MVGTGPFGRRPAGSFNFEVDAPAHRLYLERTPRRVRAVVDGEVVTDSTSAYLLHETGLTPVYYLPRRDVREELLESSETSTHCPFKGDASYWHLRAGNQLRHDAVWAYPEPIAGAPPLSDLLAFDFDAIDEWYEEAERIGVHPRDPYHRCDVVPSDRHVTIRVAGQVVAESVRATLLFETGLRPRYYLPPEDVDPAYLEESATATSCPYKGSTSRHHSIRVGDTLVEDALWVYDDPRDEVRGIAGLMGFYDEKLEVEDAPQRWQVPGRPRVTAR